MFNKKEICDKWLKNKTINPETSRKIKENGTVFKELLKKCSLNQIENKEHKDIYLKNYISSIKHKNNCLKLYKKINKTLIYKIGNDIILDKILDKSGIVFLGHYNHYNFTVKILEQNTINNYELLILKELTKKVIELKCPHFIFNYGYLKCVKLNIPTDETKYYPSIINKNNNLYFQINKLESGNLNNILKLFHDNNDNVKILLNTLIQLLFSIMFFHKYINAFHCNTHCNNFLYHKIRSGGYFHYNIYGKDYYLENIGYLWVMSDFNSIKPFIDSKEINNNKFGNLISFIPAITDYEILINELLKYQDTLPNIIKNIIIEIKIKVFNKYNKNVNSFLLQSIDNDILNILIKFIPTLTTINNPSKIINKTPFIILETK
jgi:hypothetical protein